MKHKTSKLIETNEQALTGCTNFSRAGRRDDGIEGIYGIRPKPELDKSSQLENSGRDTAVDSSFLQSQTLTNILFPQAKFLATLMIFPQRDTTCCPGCLYSAPVAFLPRRHRNY